MNTCPRCQGLLVGEWIQDEDSPRQIRMLRCPLCAYYTDYVMERNKLNPSPAPYKELKRTGAPLR